MKNVKLIVEKLESLNSEHYLIDDELPIAIFSEDMSMSELVPGGDSYPINESGDTEIEEIIIDDSGFTASFKDGYEHDVSCYVDSNFNGIKNIKELYDYLNSNDSKISIGGGNEEMLSLEKSDSNYDLYRISHRGDHELINSFSGSHKLIIDSHKIYQVDCSKSFSDDYDDYSSSNPLRIGVLDKVNNFKELIDTKNNSQPAWRKKHNLSIDEIVDSSLTCYIHFRKNDYHIEIRKTYLQYNCYYNDIKNNKRLVKHYKLNEIKEVIENIFQQNYYYDGGYKFR